MIDTTYNVIKPESGVPIKAWTKGVQLEDAARQQLLNVAQVAVYLQVGGGDAGCPLGNRRHCRQRDSHAGAIIPAAVGVDIGCGMMAVQTSLHDIICRTICTASARRSRRRCRTDGPDNGSANDRGA